MLLTELIFGAFVPNTHFSSQGGDFLKEKQEFNNLKDTGVIDDDLYNKLNGNGYGFFIPNLNYKLLYNEEG